MAFYIQRERYIFDSVESQNKMTFPTAESASFTLSAFRDLPPYKNLNNQDWLDAQSQLPNSDIVYQGINLPRTVRNGGIFQNDDGNFDIYLPGTYLIFWFVSQVSGKSEDGVFFQLKKYNENKDSWGSLSKSGESLKVSASSGCTPLVISSADLELNGKVTIALFNESPNSVLMNRSPFIKAALGIFGFGAIGGDVENIQNQIQELLNSCDLDKRNRIVAIRKKIKALQVSDLNQLETLRIIQAKWQALYDQFIIHSVPGWNKSIDDPTSDFYGLTFYFIRNGYEFQFWSGGTLLNGSNGGTIIPAVTFPAVSNGRKYLITSADFPPLTLFNYEFEQNPLTAVRRSPVVTLCYKGEAPASPFTHSFPMINDAVSATLNIWPLFIDETGIYFDTSVALTSANGIRNGHVVKFCEIISFYNYNPNFEANPEDGSP